MAEFPSLPAVDDVPDVTSGGHLWLLEHVDGYPLAFTVEEGGWIDFGGPDGSLGEPAPPQYRPAIRHVRESVDRTVLGDVPIDAVFYGVATSYKRIAYDWERLPHFLGVDVRSGEQLFAPDAADRAFRRLDLTPVNAFGKEVAARHFSLSSYDVPSSDWYDGPPLGVVVRNKAGGRGLLSTPGFDPGPPDPPADDPVAVAESLTTPGRIEALIRDLEAEGRALDFDTIRRRVVESVVREEWGAITAFGRSRDPESIVDAIEGSTREYLVAERPELLEEQ